MIGYSSFTGKYQASLRVMGKLVFLGEYNSFKDAEKAVNSAAEIADNGQHADLYKLCVNR
jgi:hypothetical protein